MRKNKKQAVTVWVDCGHSVTLEAESLTQQLH